MNIKTDFRKQKRVDFTGITLGKNDIVKVGVYSTHGMKVSTVLKRYGKKGVMNLLLHYDLEEEILEGELQRVVRRMAEELPEKYRLVVYLYYSREQKIEEIASMLHIPKGTVKSRLHKARSMMKDRMEAEGYEISER